MKLELATPVATIDSFLTLIAKLAVSDQLKCKIVSTAVFLNSSKPFYDIFIAYHIIFNFRCPTNCQQFIGNLKYIATLVNIVKRQLVHLSVVIKNTFESLQLTSDIDVQNCFASKLAIFSFI